MYRTVPGLEHARIVKMAYAIEYDCINALQLEPTFEFKKIHGLYSGGQFNGSSGYEEAAAQGLYAGINAAMKILGREALFIDRSEGYIGVLVDDLITKENHEPYRMMTSRAEYRLLLRQDNAELRLLEKGYRCGLISEDRYQRFLKKKQQIQDEIERVKRLRIGAGAATQQCLAQLGSTPLSTSATMEELSKRPELDYRARSVLDPDRPSLPYDVQEEINIEIKYEGYITRQEKQVRQFRKMEEKKIPEDIDYDQVPSLRNEARQKLMKVRPASIGQASRVMGVNPADVSVLMVYLKGRNQL
jgi:tRNA uridine 5-carboxymethylaminomethyl modification enzyme